MGIPALLADVAHANPGPLPAVLFYLFAAMTVGSAITVALSRNIVRTAIGLLFALTGVAGLYFLLHAEFIAAVQLVVYVGGTLILIIFGVMLTSRSPSERYLAKPIEVVWAVAIALLITVPLGVALVRFAASRSAGQLPEAYPIQQLGHALLAPTGYLVPFELVSVLLLAVMIGAAYLAKRNVEHPSESGQE